MRVILYVSNKRTKGRNVSIHKSDSKEPEIYVLAKVVIIIQRRFLKKGELEIRQGNKQE